MHRRDSAVVLLALAALARTARSQPRERGRPFRIATVPDWVEGRWLADELAALGWVEGRDWVLARTGVPVGDQRLEQSTRNAIAGQADLIFVYTTSGAIAAHGLSATIPIVMYTSGYPVEAGLADSLARPGRNVTGASNYAGTGVWSKLPELLCELKPGTRRIGVYWTYGPPKFAAVESALCFEEFRRAERSLGVSIEVVDAPTPADTPRAIARIDAGRFDALIVTAGDGIAPATDVVRFARARRVPTIADWPWSTATDPYPTMAFGPSMREMARSSAGYIDRIMRGARPADLPIQQPAKFVLVVSARSAREIGIEVPPALRLRADLVLE